MNLTQIPDSLPNKPSELIRLALRDLRTLETCKDYSINMATFHKPDGLTKCEVCLAGAVMACTLCVPKHQRASPMSFTDIIGYTPSRLEKKLLAINCLRVGCPEEACLFLGRTTSLKPRFITLYHKNRRCRRYNFFKDMNQLADDLAQEGN